jgi:hypothetical protein
MEKNYAFIKNNRVALVAVFESENTAVADLVKTDNNFDSYIWLDDSEVPHIHSTYDGTTFTQPTIDYLISIGVTTPVVEEVLEEEAPTE